MSFLVLGMTGFTLAEESDEAVPALISAPAEEVALPSAEPTGFFGRTFDNWGLAFTFNAEKRIEKSLALAEKRLAEAEKLAESDPEAAELARERYEHFLAKAEGALAKLEAKESKDLNKSQEQLEKMTQMQNRFEEHRETADAIHVRTIERLQARNASDEQIAKMEEAFGKAAQRFEKSIEEANQKQEKAKLKYKVLGDLTDDEIEAKIADIEGKAGIAKSRAERIVREEVRVEKYEQAKNKQVSKLQERIDANGNLTAEDKDMLQKRIENAQAKMKDFAEKAEKNIAQNQKRTETQEQARKQFEEGAKKALGELKGKIDEAKKDLAETNNKPAETASTSSKKK